MFGFACVRRTSQLICGLKNQDSARVLKKLCFSSKPHCTVKPRWRKTTKTQSVGILMFAGGNADKKRIQTRPIKR
jgi:hypothetical protein